MFVSPAEKLNCIVWIYSINMISDSLFCLSNEREREKNKGKP